MCVVECRLSVHCVDMGTHINPGQEFEHTRDEQWVKECAHQRKCYTAGAKLLSLTAIVVKRTRHPSSCSPRWVSRYLRSGNLLVLPPMKVQRENFPHAKLFITQSQVSSQSIRGTNLAAPRRPPTAATTFMCVTARWLWVRTLRHPQTFSRVRAKVPLT